MNIALFKIWCASFSNLGLGVQSLNRLPSAVTDAIRVFLGRNEENLQFVMVCLFVDFKYYATDFASVNYDSVSFAIRRVNAMLNGFARDNFSIKIDVMRVFDDVQKITKCSTGCGGCHDKVPNVISEVMMG